MQQAIIPGTVIDKRYQIQKKIPDTTSNICYLAEDTDQSNRLVVITFPRMELQTLPGFTASFAESCQKLMKARLNGIIKILDHGEYDSQPYAVLQYVTHETLGSILTSNRQRQKKSTVEEVLDWARPLAVTLDELHGLGYVHSNVRPDMISLGDKQQILLGDFISEYTIQKLGASKQAISSLDIGDYLAPEYIKSHYNETYDQYLLATVVYEALASRAHFHNPGSTEAYRRQVATKYPEPLLTHRPELVGASRILGKALERNPVKRFASCREFVNQLGSAQINPTFGGAGDKPVTVIRKVLDLDETAPAEPIITSIRSRRAQQGRNKGIAWLGILFLAVGASAYAVNHYGGIEQFKLKLTTALADLSPEGVEPSVVIPVDLSKKVTLEQKTDSSTVSTNAPVLDSKTAEVLPKGETTLSANGVGATETAKVDVSIESSSVVDAATGAEPATNESGASQGVGEVSEEVLKELTDLALTEGEAEFKRQATEVEPQVDAVITTSDVQIGDAVSLALQEAQADFMRQASPASSEDGDLVVVDDVATEEVELNIPESAGNDADLSSPEGDTETTIADEAVSTENTESVEVAEELSPEVETATSVTNAEFATLDLNAQIQVANRLADEQAAAARKLFEDKKRQREQQAKQQQLQAQVNTGANADGQSNSQESMQQARDRIQALKAQKVARITRVTKDCVSSGKIHRQVAAGNLSFVKNCLSVGVNPNLTQGNRKSLLHLASEGGHLNVAKLLVAKGAEVNAKTADGKTPLDVATERNQGRILSYLRSRGGESTR